MNVKPSAGPKKRPGRPPRHGAYSLMVRAGELPKRRTYLRAYLAEVRASLIADLGPMETDLTMAQRVMINSVVSKLSIIRCIEEHIKETGVFHGRELSPVLAKSYVTYGESLRRDLQALGVSTRKEAEILDLGQYVAAKDREAREGKTPDQEAGGGEIVDPGASQAVKPDQDAGEQDGEEREDS